MALSRTALWIVLFAVVNGLVAQSLESYTAHGLVELTGDTYAPDLFHMAAKYHMWHVLALFFIALIIDRMPEGLPRKLLLVTVGFFVVGTLMFCGGMYSIPFGGSVYIAAAGAVVFVTGWVVFVAATAAAIAATRKP
jgi:uncharacterized membrane protein YgdD (TMEM256/DUF423 family)